MIPFKHTLVTYLRHSMLSQIHKKLAFLHTSPLARRKGDAYLFTKSVKYYLPICVWQNLNLHCSHHCVPLHPILACQILEHKLMRFSSLKKGRNQKHSTEYPGKAPGPMPKRNALIFSCCFACQERAWLNPIAIKKVSFSYSSKGIVQD